MSIRCVHCPRCRAAANISAGMATVRCSSCGSIWNPNDSPQTQVSDSSVAQAKKSHSRSQAESPPLTQNGAAKIIGGMLVAGLGIGLITGGMWYLRQPDATTTTSRTVSTEQATPVSPVPQGKATPIKPYREIDLPESTRQQIYRDYRTAKGSSVGKPIPMPKDWDSRKAVDATLTNMLDRELTLHASIHNIQVDDIVQIINEGNAKGW